MNNSSPAMLQNAITQWQRLLGHDNVVLNPDLLEQLATATFATEQQVLVELLPQREQLAELLAIARQCSIPLYTISSGKNWGYGSAVPCQSGAAIVNLRRLKNISEYTPEQHAVRVEAGVSQQELAQYLTLQGDKHWMDCTGSSPDCSIVGNYVERGFGHTVMGEHSKYICGMEVMLADGRIINTGLYRFANALAAPVYQSGLGPGLDGLFLQSNLGIVLSLNIWLMPKPECYLPFFINTQQDASLELLVTMLQKLKQQGYLLSLPHIANAYRVLPGMQLFPYAALPESSNIFPLTGGALQALKKKWRVGVWNVSGALYGTHEQVSLAKRMIKRALKAIPDAEINFISERKLLLLERYSGVLAKLSGMDIPAMLRVLRSVYDMMRGQPSSYFLKSAYWRKTAYPKTENYQLDADGVGLIWCAFVAPATASCARDMMFIIENTLSEYGFEPGVTFTLLNERCLDAVVSISFDRTGQHPNGLSWDTQAQQCRALLYDRMLAAGFYPYRLDIQMMQTLLNNSEAGYNQLLTQLKQCLDPDKLLSPGRYIP